MAHMPQRPFSNEIRHSHHLLQQSHVQESQEQDSLQEQQSADLAHAARDEQDSLRFIYADYLAELKRAKLFVDYTKTAYALESGQGAVPPPAAALP